MELLLTRKTFTEKSTIGELTIDGKFFCYTLEDASRGLTQSDSIVTIKLKKILGVTAIPTGVYRVIMNESARFKKIMPLIVDVKGFAGVRIHAGNYPTDTEGCILCGMGYAPDKLINSKDAITQLYALLNSAYSNGELITLTIK